jgi:hypothetical protein
LCVIQTATESCSTNEAQGESLDNDLAGHVGIHLIDVASAAPHTVEPWFNGRVTFSLRPPA